MIFALIRLAHGRFLFVAAGVIISLACIAVVVLIARSSPNADEVAHLPAGLACLGYDRNDVYPVNPPVAKSILAIPAYLAGTHVNFRSHLDDPRMRSEFRVGVDYFVEHGPRAISDLKAGRLCLLPFFVLSASLVFAWSRSLFGDFAGIASLLLFVSNPTVLTCSAAGNPDMAGTALMFASLWTFRAWLRSKSAVSLIVCGVITGLAIATKFTAFLLWFILVLLIAVLSRDSAFRRTVTASLLLLTSILTVDVCYGFRNTFVPLGSIPLYSKHLRSDPQFSRPNRFSNSQLGSIPFPLPKELLVGLDVQKRDFECGNWSYLRGVYQRSGWWYWYAYAVLVKEPVSLLVLVFAGAACLLRMAWVQDHAEPILLLLPALLFFAVVSWNFGFTQFLRYVLPCYPFAAVAAGATFRERDTGHDRSRIAACWGLIAWSILSVAFVYPYPWSYFNELAGGPTNGLAHLSDYCIDWGQDIEQLVEWQKQHPDRVLWTALKRALPDELLGIHGSVAPAGPNGSESLSHDADTIGPQPGWYAASLTKLHRPDENYRYLLQFEPVERIGYSILIFHISEVEAMQVRTRLLTEMANEKNH